jgi:uncharacterized protein (TIGR00369 family)
MAKLIDLIKAKLNDPLAHPAVAKLVGFTMTHIEEGKAVFEMQTGPQHANFNGSLHGGIMCDIMDAAMGLACGSTLEDTQRFTTTELKINYLRPVWNAKLTATAWVVHRGKTMCFTECELKDENNKLIAKASSSLMLLRADSFHNVNASGASKS